MKNQWRSRRNTQSLPQNLEEDNTYLSYNLVVGDILDRKLYLAFDVLDYALLGAPGAPLKQALIDAGIGKDIVGGYDSSTMQPVFSIIAKNANSADKEKFLATIQDVLNRQVKDGVDKKALLAGISASEFRYRLVLGGSIGILLRCHSLSM